MADALCPPCPTLPSSTTAAAVWDGASGWPLLVARDVVVRGGIIAAALWAAGDERPVRGGLVGALAIEAVVLAWVGLNRPRPTAPVTSTTAPQRA